MDKVFIATGGSGGHIYPAIEVAKELTTQGYEVHFVGTKNGMEAKVVKYPLHCLWAGKLNYQGQWVKKILSTFKVFIACLQSLIILIKYNPKVVIGFGGYTTGAFVLTSFLLRKKTIIWEGNVTPGLTNLILGKFVNKVLVNFPQSKDYFKNPVIVDYPIRPGFSAKLRIPKKINNILVLGGSQGAYSVLKVVQEFVKNNNSYNWLIQTGGKLEIENSNLIKTEDFILDMPKALAWADVVISRAGAGAIAEILYTKNLSILVPLNTVDGHQDLNAFSLEENNQAKVIKNDNFNVKTLQENLYFLENEEIRSHIFQSLNISKLGNSTISEEVIRILKS